MRQGASFISGGAKNGAMDDELVILSTAEDRQISSIGQDGAEVVFEIGPPTVDFREPRTGNHHDDLPFDIELSRAWTCPEPIAWTDDVRDWMDSVVREIAPQFEVTWDRPLNDWERGKVNGTLRPSREHRTGARTTTPQLYDAIVKHNSKVVLEWAGSELELE